MVSIPDWSRLQRLGDIPVNKERTSHRSRYYRQREEETIKQAEEQGYFLNPCRSLLEQNFLPHDDNDALNGRSSNENKFKEKDLSQIFFVKLSYSHLRTVGDIGLCSNLTVCILNNNFITRFDALVSCLFLMKLDLHGNQISTLAGPVFWSALQFLKLLHLHDNPIGNIENLQYLSSCLNLTILTLYDTPLSLKKNYRHHAVNSIWTLKALDNFVISDEEIIEDAEFEGRFSTLHPSLNIDLCPHRPEDSTYDEELVTINELLRRVNSIMAHNSPVLIIQRFIRGFLARKKIGKTACRWVKQAHSGPEDESRRDCDDTVVPPPGSPISTGQAEHITVQVDPISTTGDSTKMDYDTYMLNRRPGSISDGSVMNSSRYGLEVTLQTPSAGGEDRRKKTNIRVNLTKLHSSTLQSLNDAAASLDTDLQIDFPFMSEIRPTPPETRQSRKRWKEQTDEKPKRKIIKDIKQFFGPIVEALPSPEPEYSDLEVPIIDFRLKGLKKQIRITDPTMDMIISRREMGQDIRQAEDEFHYHLDNLPRPCIKREPTITTDQRLFNKVHGTMGLSCLNAIQQAYRDREKIEQNSARMEYILAMKGQRDTAKQRIKLYKDEQRNRTLHQRAGDHKKLVETLEKRNMLRLSYLDKRGEHRQRTTLASRERKRELTFIHDFNVQNTSVSNALLRHDRQSKHEDKTQSNVAVVTSKRAAEKEQQEMVKKYMEHRTLMRQTESAMSRATLDTRMLQEANDRIMQAKARVAQQKAKSANVTAAQPSTPSLPPVIHYRFTDQKLRRWNTDIQMNAMPPGPVAKAKDILTSVI